MKKFYISLFSLTVAVGANAQFLEGTSGSNQSREIQQSPRLTPLAQDLGTNPVTENIRGGGGTVAWSDDFSDPTTWTLDNDGQGVGFGWRIGATSTGWFWGGTEINSTSDGNYAELLNGDPSVTPATQEIGVTYTLTTAQRIDVLTLAGTDAVILEFEQWGARFNDDQSVWISTDSINFVKVGDNSDFDQLTNLGGSEYPNSTLESINITPVIQGNPDSVWVRFQWTSAFPNEANPNAWVAYGWFIDDVAIVAATPNDMQLLNVWQGSGDIFSSGFDYTQIPLAQAHEVFIGAVSLNQGGATQTEVTYTYDISVGGISVNSGSFPAASSSMSAAVVDTTWFGTGFIPDAEGTYVVTVTVSSAEGDDDATNNEGTAASFKITEFTFAQDGGSSSTILVEGPEDDLGALQPYQVAVNYEIFETATIYGIEVAFGQGTTIDACAWQIYELSEDAPDPIEITSEVFDIVPGTVSSASQLRLVTMPVDGGEGVELEGGKTYRIAVGTANSGDKLNFRASAGDVDFGTVQYGDFGATGSPEGWYVGFGYSVLVRAIFDPSVGISENQDLTGIQMFPNPANDVLTVKFSANESNDIRVNVIGMDGKMVYSQSVNAFSGQFTSRINLEGVANGLYSVQVISDNASFTQKVAVVK